MISQYTNTQLINMFLDYFNNFLTVSAFADYYGISDILAPQLLLTGKSLHNASVLTK